MSNVVWGHLGQSFLIDLVLLGLCLPFSLSWWAQGPWHKLPQERRTLPDVHDWRRTLWTKPLIGTRLVSEAIQWSAWCGACIGMNGGEIGDGWVKGEIGDRSCVFCEWNWFIVYLVMRGVSGLPSWAPATVAQDDVKNVFGMSQGCYMLLTFLLLGQQDWQHTCFSGHHK
jgi:hypothetical protein